MSYIWLLVISAFYAIDAEMRFGIYGGSDIDISKAPYMVSIRMEGMHWCGGSIIDKRFILTAAHCVLQNQKYTAVVGHTELDENKVIDNTYEIDNYIRHPKFSSTNFENDVAIMRVSKPFVFTDKVSSLNLALEGYELKDGQLLTISGWGQTESKEVSNSLLTVEVPYIPSDVCQKSYNEIKQKITEKMICAGKPGKDACTGDSGGPLVDSDQIQVGITSFGVGCGTATPGVYSKVSALNAWITETLKNMA